MGRSHYECKEIRDAGLVEELQCGRETDSGHHLFAVAGVLMSGLIVKAIILGKLFVVF